MTRTAAAAASLAVVAAAASLEPASASEEESWKDLAPLLGDWVGTGSGRPGEGSGGFTLRPEIGGSILVRRNFAEYPAAKDRPASRHEDLMVIFKEGGATRADYFDNEGHVIHYAVTASPSEGKVTFLSDPAVGPRFRLTYALEAPGEISILFEIAPPGAPEEFRRYVEARARRRAG